MKLVVDTSAIVACMTGEPEAGRFAELLELADTRVLSSLNLLESRLVIAFSKGMLVDTVDDFLAEYQIDIIPFDEALSDRAFEAYRRFGKGRHPAKLNMGDCAAYALARARGWPLLYKGEDFSLTDIERA
ncbi:type II toxin-antitoxin system VapC family toxin [Bosea sp. AAP35]|uniref:type II toxin-antitoxin system VapC family toxin n=1 Tax=Bosea sp. AAP35 TaxID=1523417 RepID=UPI0009EA9FFB|nr:type II toxin-antitoxin system VapC family toxin [Bosea sp. AAP35]